MRTGSSTRILGVCFLATGMKFFDMNGDVMACDANGRRARDATERETSSERENGE